MSGVRRPGRVPYGEEVAALVERLGGPVGVAEALGIAAASVVQWRVGGSVPGRTWARLVRIGERRDAERVVTESLRVVVGALQAVQRGRAILTEHTNSKAAREAWDALAADLHTRRDALLDLHRGLVLAPERAC